MAREIEIPKCCDYTDLRPKKLSKLETDRLTEVITAMTFEEQVFVASLLDHSILARELETRIQNLQFKLGAVERAMNAKY